jgi:glutamate synthase domain-containing protein 2
LAFGPGQAIPVDEVEPVGSIMRHFVGGAMSLGSLSPEAHETIAQAFNAIGSMSNCGEGGENAERFGLSQLHQLRGRVGRGADQSYCILVTNYQLGKTSTKRVQIMTETNDGFEIAEADLKLRGPGDLEGTKQSGIAFDLKLANLARDGQIVQLARDTATRVLDEDPSLARPENALLKKTLDELRADEMNWSSIS